MKNATVRSFVVSGEVTLVFHSENSVCSRLLRSVGRYDYTILQREAQTGLCHPWDCACRKVPIHAAGGHQARFVRSDM